MRKFIDIVAQSGEVDFLTLQQTCEHMELGFYFEEGGCFGMALALRDHFSSLGNSCALAIQEIGLHAYCVVGGTCFDYTGPNSRCEATIVSDEEFMVRALEAGHSPEGIEADRLLAREAIASSVA